MKKYILQRLDDNTFLHYHNEGFYEWIRCVPEQAPTYTEYMLESIISAHGEDGRRPFGIKVQIHTIF